MSRRVTMFFSSAQSLGRCWIMDLRLDKLVSPYRATARFLLERLDTPLTIEADVSEGSANCRAFGFRAKSAT